MSTMHTVLEAMAPEARLAHSHQVTFRASIRTSTNAGGPRSSGSSSAAPATLTSPAPRTWSSTSSATATPRLVLDVCSLQLAPRLHREVRALEFDAAAVRRLCNEDSAVGRSVSVAVGAVIADRLDSARTRLLDLFAPHGSGTPLAYAR